MDDIDEALAWLATDRVPARLAATETVILARVSGHCFGTSEIPGAWRTAGVAAALIMGIAGGLLPNESARATHSLSPLDGSSALAPSALLTGHR